MAKNEQQVCIFCGEPATKMPSGDFRVPVCGSEECQVRYYTGIRQIYALIEGYALIAGIGGRTLM